MKTMDSAGQIKPESGKHGGERPNSGAKPTECSDDSTCEVRRQKAFTEKYQAKIAELEYLENVGELDPVSEVEEAWTAHAQIAKGRLLALPCPGGAAAAGRKRAAAN